MMRAIAWDDEPEVYFNSLVDYLEPLGIEMVIQKSEDSLISELSQNPEDWDLVITDLVRLENDGSEDKEVGARIARFAVAKKPVYIVTQAYDEQWHKHDVPATVQIRPKRTPPAYMAAEIKRDLEQRGLFYDRSLAGIIYGHDRDARLVLEAFLSEDCGLNVEMLDAESFTGNLLSDLRSLFSRAGIVVVLNTPDDHIKPKEDKKGKDSKKEKLEEKDSDEGDYWQPRQNVLFEMGMVLGAANGDRRLISVQRWGDKNKHKSLLPSDFGAWLNIRYKDKIEMTFPAIREKLRRLRILPPEES